MRELAAKSEPQEMLDAVDPHRQKFGLKPFKELRGEGGDEKATLLIQQKIETVDALSKIAQPCPGVREVSTIFPSVFCLICFGIVADFIRYPRFFAGVREARGFANQPQTWHP